MTKRAFDLILSLVGLLVLFPALLVIAIAIWWGDRGPVFYRQIRIGRNGRPFFIWKFRSMLNQAKPTGLAITVAGDRRITRVGRFIRRYKLDELPQLLNVLVGEMSLVGPRPEVPRYVELYSDEQRQVLAVRPGITDPASLKYRDEERLLASASDPEMYYRTVCMPSKLAINLQYAQRASIWTDVLVVAETIMAVFGFRSWGWKKRWPFASRASLIFGSLVLLAAISRTRFQTTGAVRDRFLAQSLPERQDGWMIADLPLANTEFVASKAIQKLDFDDYVYRRFDRTGEEFDVYAAYWKAGKLASSMVAAHTPDICWVSGGWQKLEERSSVTLALRGGETRAGEWRIFTTPTGIKRYVLFWHVGAGGFEGYGRGLTGWKYIWVRLRQLRRELFATAAEQYFVRVSSNIPFMEWHGIPLFESVMHELGRLALYDTGLGLDRVDGLPK